MDTETAKPLIKKQSLIGNRDCRRSWKAKFLVLGERTHCSLYCPEWSSVTTSRFI